MVVSIYGHLQPRELLRCLLRSSARVGRRRIRVQKPVVHVVEMPNGRLDCGMQGFPSEPPPPAEEQKDQDKDKEKKRRIPAAQKDRFRGVRIFDISDIKNPKQVAAVQTCRGSHTHTLVVDPNDKENVYIYVSGTSFVRQPEELAGCSAKKPDKDPNTALFRIEVIQVPVAAPQNAKVVSSPRLFMDARTGAMNGLSNGGITARKARKSPPIPISATTSRSIRRLDWLRAPAPEMELCSTSKTRCIRSVWMP